MMVEYLVGLVVVLTLMMGMLIFAVTELIKVTKEIATEKKAEKERRKRYEEQEAKKQYGRY